MIIINGEKRYVPYVGCPYYFKTLEACRERIDLPNVAMVNTKTFTEMWNQFK